MKINIISEADYKTSNWSGGETTELFLFPPNGDYASRKFDYRISTAKVNLKESDFTSLPGYNRLIMSLDNPLELHHNNGKTIRKVTLSPFEVNRFSGSDKTQSFGECQDFNLIYSEKIQGEMIVKYATTVTRLQVGVTYIYYAIKKVEINILEQQVRLNKGDTLILSDIMNVESIHIGSSKEDKGPLVIEVSVH